MIEKIYLIERWTLTGTTTRDQSVNGSKGNEEVL